MTLRSALEKVISRSGYQVHRSDGVRRGLLLRHFGVDMVLDVGAAAGRYSQQLRRFGFQGRILSIEPLDNAFIALQAIAKYDDKWEVAKIALGSQPGSAQMNVAGNSDSSSLLPMLDRHLGAAPHTALVDRQQTDVTTLDLLYQRYPAARRPFIKIDTQGSEGAVLDGAQCLLRDSVGVQIELSFIPLYEGGMLYEEAIIRLSKLGFSLANLELGFRDPTSQQLLQADGIFFRNSH